MRGYGGDDKLYGDVYSDVMYGDAGNDHLNGLEGGDRIFGGAGNDLIEGWAGNDILYGDDGTDTVFGGEGADTFLFMKNTAYSGVDTLRDFNISQNDRINIKDLLEGYDPLTKSITDFVQIASEAGKQVVKVDADGGGNNFVAIATIGNIPVLTDEQALVNSGHLIVA